MSYQVLARKWRPKSFDMLVGQPFVKRALSNALTRQQLHHAYLFSGTRGVGKTTIARIFAKCLNCEQGVTATPCGTCSTCESIDAGRFIDLIEVDAASRTRVEDTRELLENVQYLPVQGRFKVYLIDEVHMLSGHSFNALLKTLEEPPAHVKFLLATTEPERLPVTVLSRCLRFDLQPITESVMSAHLAYILEQEHQKFEILALDEVAKAAKGSLRDALSLLEQALAFCEDTVSLEDVQTLLGLGNQNLVGPLLSALLEHQADVLFQQVEEMEQKGVAFEAAMDTLLEYLHALAIANVLPNGMPLPDTIEKTTWQAWREKINPEEIQLFYQIGIMAKQDLAFAPTARKGFEMMLLRMLCFKPALQEKAMSQQAAPKLAEIRRQPQPSVQVAPIPQQQAPRKIQPAPAVMPAAVESPPAVAETKQVDLKQRWADVVAKLPLVGLVQVIAQSSVVVTWDGAHLSLNLDPTKMACLNDARRDTLEKTLSQYLGKTIKLTIVSGEVGKETPAAIAEVKKQKKQTEVEVAIHADPSMQAIIQAFDATVEKIIPNE